MPSLGSIGNQLESVSKFAPDRFRAQFMVGLGYASPNRFKVDLPSIDGMSYPDEDEATDLLGEVLGSVNGETRNMLCTAVNLPGKEIQTIERNYGTEKRQIASGHTFPPVQMTFYLTNTYSMRKYWGNWMKSCASHSASGPMYVGYQSNYAKQISVTQYTKNARRVMSVKLIDAFPVSLSSVELNNQPQTAISELTVSIAYRTYEEEYRWDD